MYTFPLRCPRPFFRILCFEKYLLKTLLKVDNEKWLFYNLYPDNAGEYRRAAVYVGGFAPPNAQVVPQLMEEFGVFLQSDEFKKLHPIRQAALAHHRLTYIHPFV